MNTFRKYSGIAAAIIGSLVVALSIPCGLISGSLPLSIGLAVSGGLTVALLGDISK